MRAPLVWTAALLSVGGVAWAERLPIRTYGEADGLPSTAVLSILQDSRGFLWFATRDGLARFDGARFVAYGMEHGLPVPTIERVLQSRNGSYWIVTARGGVVGLDSGAAWGETRAGAAPLFREYLGAFVYADSTGRVWIDDGDRLVPWEQADAALRGRATMDPVPLSPGTAVNGVAEGKDGSLWSVRRCGLQRVLRDGRLACYALEGPLIIRPLAVDREGRVWLGEEQNGIIVLQPGPAASVAPVSRALLGGARETVPPDGRLSLDLAAGQALHVRLHPVDAEGQVGDLLMTSDGHLWLATSGGLVEYDGNGFRRYSAAQGLVDRVVGSLAEDHEGNLWFGGYAGAAKLTRNGFTSFDEADGLGHARIYALYEDAAGHLIAVGQNWHLSRFQGGRFRNVKPRVPQGLAPYLSQAAFLDRSGQWWILGGDRLERFPPSRRLEDLEGRPPPFVYEQRDGLIGAMPFRLFEDKQGDVWIGGFLGGGLSRWHRASGRIEPFEETRRTGQDGLSALAEDGSGVLWVGYTGGGLMRRRAERFVVVPEGEGAPRGMITALHRDDAGRLWIGSNRDGLTRVDDPGAEQPRFVRYTTAQGLASNNVRCLTSDRLGRIYAGTARGVDRLDPSRGLVRHYTTSDGLANAFTITALRDHEGTLWFGTAHGLSRLVPEPDRAPVAPPVWIGGLRVAGAVQPVSHLGQLVVQPPELGAGRNQLQIDFFGLSVAAGGGLRYQYQLEGADRDWSPPTAERTVNYSRLAPGKYRFLVRAVSAEGTASEDPARVAFTVLPPLWQRWWFQALLALAAVMGAYAAHRYRVRRLLEVERVRTRIASDLHDDIGSSLSQIAILSEVGRRQAAGGAAAEPLERIGSLSRASVDAMGDIVWAIDPHKDRLLDLTQRLRGLAGEVLEPAGMAFSFEADEAPDLRLGADVRREVFLVCKESLNNAVRHSGARRVEVSLRQDDDQLLLHVSDDGRGFDPASPGAGNGIASMRRRGAALGGHFEIRSLPGQGTKVRLAVPLRRPHRGPTYIRDGASGLRGGS